MSSEHPPEDPPYSGPERRKSQRRKDTDRREAVRFELEKEPRRSGKDRRRSGQDLWERRDS